MNNSERPLALITGASSGIGLEMAKCFAEGGHDLILVARRREILDPLAVRLSSEHQVNCHVVVADLASASSIDALLSEIAAHGLVVDVLVNNAGYGIFGEFSETALDDERAMMRVNMEALTILSKRFLPQLIQRRGGIINVASTAAFQPGPYMAVYYATKAFVLSLSEALAEELAPQGVHVMALCPGPTRSGFQARAAMEKSGLLRMPLPDAASVARFGYQAFRQGRRVAIPGLVNRLMVQSLRLTPRRWVTALVKRISAPRPS